MLPKTRRRCLSVESLEDRVVMSAPRPLPGTPLELPQGGAWRNTTFIGSPVLADLDGDGTEEILTAAAGGRLVAYSAGADGQLREFRRYETGAEANFKSTPVVVRRPDGSKMIVAGLGRDEFASPAPLEDGRVFAWDAVSGQVLPGWPRGTGVGGVVGPLAAGDLTGDGIDEIVVTSFNGSVHAFRQDGSVLWLYENDDSVQSGAAIGDIDRDGSPEVVFGADSSESIYFHAGGFVTILNANGATKSRIPTGEVIWSSPVLADLTGDGFLEMVVGTGLNFSLTDPTASPERRAEARLAANQILAYDHQGQVVPGWPYRTTADPSANRQVYSSPAVADLDGDGMLEVAAMDLAGYLHVVRGDGRPMPGFDGGRQLLPPIAGTNDTYTSPIIADADGDGSPDLIVSARQTLFALDASGDELWRLPAPTAPGGTPDGFVNAAAVGQVDGSGGLELVIATNALGVPNPPRGVGAYELPESPLTPPWPMHRRTADSTPVTQSPAFLAKYVRASFRALLGREATDNDIRVFSGMMMANEWSPKVFAETVALTPEARTVVIRQLYQSYLQRPPTEAEVAAGQQQLEAGRAVDLARQLVLSDESLARTDGTIPGVLGRFYETILRRPITAGEVAILEPVIRSGIVPMPEIARLLLLSEEFVLLDIAAPTVIAYRTEFPDAPFDDAAIASVVLDRNGAIKEERMKATLIATGGRYERATPIAGVVRSVLSDLEQRVPSPSEVGFWIREFTYGRTSPTAFFPTVIDGAGARAQFVREQVRSLLGREADPATVASLSNYASREELIISLASSPEYFARAGGDNPGFVRLAFLDLYGVDPLPASVLNEQVAALNGGRLTREGMIRNLVFSAPFYEKDVVELLFRFLPEEGKGVLRIPIDAPPGTAANNPDPALIRSLVSARQSGATMADTLATILGSPTYFYRSSYVRGLYRSTGVRN
ncbi:FG-GAP repeat domain-containing protein [Tautonia plasticadhaerens]|uniref:FG-GAP repeat protein n=1 Tax=Tautonia plasticadhaerens TaxID=2527974 RepID=A0A518HBU5_9BACT|nr:VCBS repeat-containing protein [Tautonia plasticadhaerens]QDV38156.1 FG-GAP repeat protein [Tautonia plasticadhaerens]